MPLSNSHKVTPITGFALEDGRKVENINLRNVDGQWLVSARLNGKPLPEREITHNDAIIFKQGSQAMTNIVQKYYSNDFKPQQDISESQSQNNKRNMGR